MTADPLRRVLAGQPPSFALLRRPGAGGPDQVDVLIGEVSTVDTLAQLPPQGGDGGDHDVLVLVPYRQIAERGFECVDDGQPLVAMRITERSALPLWRVLAEVPDVPLRLLDGHFDIDDETYAETVRRVIADEIGNGVGSNFVIRRSYLARIADYSLAHALAFFARLCRHESGAYWTFLVHTGTRTLVGATPERHVSLRGGVAVMNPISGTYRYPPQGPALSGLMEFLRDGKEREELHMVLDEELKMMARVCDGGGRISGPYLKQMARLAHTEYFIEGESTLDPAAILRETMFAPTVTGSPLESACRAISRHEPDGRGYYGGVVGLIGRDDQGERFLDSAILIRTADIDTDGNVKIGVGATLVRHSDPMSEVAETAAKAAGLLAALESKPAPLSEHPLVLGALGERRANLASFWRASDESNVDPLLKGLRVIVVDAEDMFTAMIGHQLRSLGLDVTIRRFDELYTLDDYQLAVMGPGPGDPNDITHPRIAHLYATISTLLSRRRPFVAVCLSHQVLSRLLGLTLYRCDPPRQGTQREIDLFGEREAVGFYNTFAAHSAEDKMDHPDVGLVESSRDAVTGEVYALRGARFSSMQFHAESVLTRNGPFIFAARIKEVLNL